MTFTYQDDDGTWRAMDIPSSVTSDAKDLSKKLNDYGYAINPNHRKYVPDFVYRFETVNKKRLELNATVDKLGWHDIDGQPCYVPYDRLVKLLPKSVGDRDLMDKVVWEPHGNLEGWKTI